MARRKLVYEGKAKILYEGPEAGTMVQLEPTCSIWAYSQAMPQNFGMWIILTVSARSIKELLMQDRICF